jgi:hypothetical protein
MCLRHQDWILALIRGYHWDTARKIIRSKVDYFTEGGKHGRGKGKKTLVPPPRRADFDRPYLVHRMAIYNRLCQSGLVADLAGHSNLAILSRPGTGGLTGQDRPL